MGKVSWLDRKNDQTEKYALMGLVRLVQLIFGEASISVTLEVRLAGEKTFASSKKVLTKIIK